MVQLTSGKYFMSHSNIKCIQHLLDVIFHVYKLFVERKDHLPQYFPNLFLAQNHCSLLKALMNFSQYECFPGLTLRSTVLDQVIIVSSLDYYSTLITSPLSSIFIFLPPSHYFEYIANQRNNKG